MKDAGCAPVLVLGHERVLQAELRDSDLKHFLVQDHGLSMLALILEDDTDAAKTQCLLSKTRLRKEALTSFLWRPQPSAPGRVFFLELEAHLAML